MNHEPVNIAFETYVPRMYYFCFHEEFTKKILSKFLHVLNSINVYDPIEIHLSSNGGNIDVLYSMLRLINNNPDRFKLVISGDCHSAGLFLILMTDCEKEFLPSFGGGILHNAWFTIGTNELNQKTSEGALKMKELKKLNLKVLKFVESLGVDTEKIKDARSGKDVYITRDEIIKACQFKTDSEISFKL